MGKLSDQLKRLGVGGYRGGRPTRYFAPLPTEPKDEKAPEPEESVTEESVTEEPVAEPEEKSEEPAAETSTRKRKSRKK